MQGSDTHPQSWGPSLSASECDGGVCGNKWNPQGNSSEQVLWLYPTRTTHSIWVNMPPKTFGSFLHIFAKSIYEPNFAWFLVISTLIFCSPACLSAGQWVVRASRRRWRWLSCWHSICSAPPGCTAGIGDSSCRAIILRDQVVPGGPLPVINGVTTPIGRILSPLTQLFSAFYRGPMSLHLQRS